MSQQDPISDMVARLKNANHRMHESLDMPASNLKIDIIEVLKEEGFVEDYEAVEENSHRTLRIDMKYNDGKRVIEDIERVSKPSRRVYVSKDEIPRVLGGLGVALLSTSHGVMTGQEAREKGVGGELLLKIW